jgi:hypothetical protein
MRTGIAARSVLRVGCAFLVVALLAEGSGLANPLQPKKLYDLPYPMPDAFRGIRGQDAAIRELLIFGGTIIRPETLTRAGIRPAPTHRTALLYGPPGTGKTSLVRALVDHLNADERPGSRRAVLRNVDVNALLSPYIGETEERIREEFEKAARKVEKKGVVVFVYLDEIDKLAQKRSAAGPDDSRGPSPALHQLLTIIGSVDWPPDVVPIASTNTVSDMDAAILRRFGWPIALPNPDKKGRHAVLDHYTELMNLRAFGTSARPRGTRLERANRWLFLRRVARKTFFMSAADIERVVRMAGILATDRRGLAHMGPAPVLVPVPAEGDAEAAADPQGSIPVTIRDFKDAVSKYWLLKESESKPVPRPRRPLFEKTVLLRLFRHPEGVAAGTAELLKDHKRARLGVPNPGRMKGPPSKEETEEARRLRRDRRGRWLRKLTYREEPGSAWDRRYHTTRSNAHQQTRVRRVR